jgi:hypothetical protein
MELRPILLEPDLVERQLAKYATHADAVSTTVRTALEALRTGTMVVDIRTVMNEAMLGPTHAGTKRGLRTTPSVAVAPARRVGRRVRLTMLGTGDLLFNSGLWRLRVPQSLQTAPTRRRIGQWEERVPRTPPYVEPRPGDLILWEASWTRVPRLDFDPALLEHIGGWLYLVREVWDLTEVERGALT